MSSDAPERLAKMLDLYRLTMLADVVRVERLLTSIIRDLRRIDVPQGSSDEATLRGCVSGLAKSLEVCETERESLSQIEKLAGECRLLDRLPH